jgi:hypothetical protein
VLLDLLSQIEPDDSWRPRPPDPTPRPYALAVYQPLILALPLDHGDHTGHGPGPSGYLRFGSVRQYQATAQPVFVPPAVTVVTPEWMPQWATPVLPGRRQDGWLAFTDIEFATPTVVSLDWLVEPPVPQGLPRRQDGWVAFTHIPLTVAIDWFVAPGGARLPLTHPVASGSVFTEPYPVLSLDWLPEAPGPVLGLRRAPEGAFILVEPSPLISTEWLPPLATPVLLQRRADGWYAFVSTVPVTPTVDQLSAWALYPDRLNRATLPPSDHPFFFYGTWVPIPNPVVTLILEDRVLIGQNQSIETPFYPSIGGSTTWS